MIEAAEELGKSAGVAKACQVLGVPRSSLYWARQPKQSPTPRPTPERALSSQEKAEFCRSLGADHVINYQETPINEAVKAIKGRAGVEVVYDPVGGTAFAQAVKCMARHGRVVLIGYSSGEWPKIDPLNAILRSYSLIGAFPGARTLEETQSQHAEMCRMAEAGQIRVPVDKVFEFSQVPEAIARVGESKAVGKVIVRGALA